MHAADQAQRSASIPRPPTGLNRGRHPTPWVKLLRGPLCRNAERSRERVADGAQGGPGGSLRVPWARSPPGLPGPSRGAQLRGGLPYLSRHRTKRDRAPDVCAPARPGRWRPGAIPGRAAPSLVRWLSLGAGGWRAERDVLNQACSAPPRAGAFRSSSLPASAHLVDQRGPPRPRWLLPSPRRAAGVPSRGSGAVSVKKRSPARQEPATVESSASASGWLLSYGSLSQSFHHIGSRQDSASPRVAQCGEAGRCQTTC